MRCQQTTSSDHIFQIFRKFFDRNLIISLICSAIVFAVTNPFYLIDNKLMGIGILKHLAYDLGSKPAYIQYFTRILMEGVTWPIEILFVLGIGYSLLYIILYLFKMENRAGNSEIHSNILLLSWICVYYLFVGSWTIAYPRYMLPIIPLLALLGANIIINAVDYISSMLNSNKYKNSILFVVCILIISIPFQESIPGKWNANYREDDPRLAAFDWIKENMQRSAVVVREQNPYYDAGEDLVETLICLQPKDYDFDLDKLIKSGANYIIVADMSKTSFNSNPTMFKYYESIDKRCILIKAFKWIKIYRISEVPLVHNETGGLRVVDSILNWEGYR
jgi:hypothetical protein